MDQQILIFMILAYLIADCRYWLGFAGVCSILAVSGHHDHFLDYFLFQEFDPKFGSIWDSCIAKVFLQSLLYSYWI